MSKIIKVGMADLNICKSPDGITTLGLGSCVGVALRDPVTKIGGLLHAMLPDSTVIKNNTCVEKFVDSGLDELVKRMVRAGANKARLEAKLAGGAQMFAFQRNSDLVKVGERNAEAARKKLRAMHIRLLAEDTGLNYGRTVIYYPETGIYVIKAVGKPEKSI
ncbi:MAG: chemotaxis protein CheD [Lachnospiraceae bacterium]|jgi:chemotaxis protein CheD|nr:chemotaxis protein CheD [Lachnospiraceae bacterium]